MPARAAVLVAGLMAMGAAPTDLSRAQAFLECRQPWDGRTVPLEVLARDRNGADIVMVSYRVPPGLTVFGRPVKDAFANLYSNGQRVRHTVVEADIDALAADAARALAARVPDDAGDVRAISRPGMPDLLMLSETPERKGVTRVTLSCDDQPPV